MDGVSLLRGKGADAIMGGEWTFRGGWKVEGGDGMNRLSAAAVVVGGGG